MSGALDSRSPLLDDVAGQSGACLWGTVGRSVQGVVWRHPSAGEFAGEGLCQGVVRGAAAGAACGDGGRTEWETQSEFGPTVQEAWGELFPIRDDAWSAADE